MDDSLSGRLSKINFDLDLDHQIDIETYDTAPPYVNVFDGLVDYTRLNRYVLYLFVALSPYLLYVLLAMLFGWERTQFTECWLRLNFSGWAFGSFLFMNYIYSKTVAIFPLLAYLANTPFNKHRLRILYDSMFVGRAQTVVCLGVACLTTATGTYLGVKLDPIPKYFIIINSFICGYIIGFGLWYSLGLAHLVYSIGGMQNVKINYLNPSYSVGVFEIPKLCSIWSLCFFGEAAIVYAGLIFGDWQENSGLAANIQLFWLLVFLVLSIFNFVNPITAVSKLTTEAKTRFKLAVLDKLHVHLNKIDEDPKSFSVEYSAIKDAEELYEKVSNARSYVFDWAVLFRFLATSIPAALIILLEQWERIAKSIQILTQGK